MTEFSRTYNNYTTRGISTYHLVSVPSMEKDPTRYDEAVTATQNLTLISGTFYVQY